jgi:hypothetical protein
MTDRSDLAAGLLLADVPPADRAAVIQAATDELKRAFTPSVIWQSAVLPGWLRGAAAYGESLPAWSQPTDLTPGDEQLLDSAWSAALPPTAAEAQRFVRVQVDTVESVRRLRTIGVVDGQTIVPSLESRGAARPLRWRWPFRVGIVAGPRSAAWLAPLQQPWHHGHVYDAELFSPAGWYDIAIIDAEDLTGLPFAVADQLGQVACVIVVGTDAVRALVALEERLEPAIAVAVVGPPEQWWWPFFEQLSHDVPVDAAVESMVHRLGLDALVAGPRYGMDITASAHWFAAVAPDVPRLESSLSDFAGWDWRSEGGGSWRETEEVRGARALGDDPVAYVRAESTSAPPPEVEQPADEAEPAPPRRLVARVLDGATALTSVLPPEKPLDLAVRIAIPEHGDTTASGPALALPQGSGPTVVLEVVVRGDVWAQQPPAQEISISREAPTQPSTWALFPFVTPGAGRLVSIEILVLYRGKPLQAATYVSPVRATAIAGERPTLTTFALSGPDEPTDQLRPVGVLLDGRGTDLVRNGHDATVSIPDVQAILNRIEDEVSRILGNTNAPPSFDDPRALRLLITLGRMGGELGTILAPLEIGDEQSINVLINAATRVLPLELVYSGPAPRDSATLCPHAVALPDGRACVQASRERVCPYAFWGLYRSIARTIAWKPPANRPRAPWTTTLSSSSVLYAATIIADDGARSPLPSDSVLVAAQGLFRPVTRVTSWTAWRRVIKSDRPNLLVLLGHTMVEGADTNLYIGRKSRLARYAISPSELTTGGQRPLVLLVACASAARGDPLGSLPGALTAKGAGAVVGTLSKIIGPHGATATTHLLQAISELAGQESSVGDAVQRARRSLIAEKRPIGLLLVSHGEMDTKVVN